MERPPVQCPASSKTVVPILCRAGTHEKSLSTPPGEAFELRDNHPHQALEGARRIVRPSHKNVAAGLCRTRESRTRHGSR